MIQQPRSKSIVSVIVTLLLLIVSIVGVLHMMWTLWYEIPAMKFITGAVTGRGQPMLASLVVGSAQSYFPA
jgi:hypothetical protein